MQGKEQQKLIEVDLQMYRDLALRKCPWLVPNQPEFLWKVIEELVWKDCKMYFGPDVADDDDHLIQWLDRATSDLSPISRPWSHQWEGGIVQCRITVSHKWPETAPSSHD